MNIACNWRRLIECSTFTHTRLYLLHLCSQKTEGACNLPFGDRCRNNRLWAPFYLSHRFASTLFLFSRISPYIYEPNIYFHCCAFHCLIFMYFIFRFDARANEKKRVKVFLDAVAVVRYMNLFCCFTATTMAAVAVCFNCSRPSTKHWMFRRVDVVAVADFVYFFFCFVPFTKPNWIIYFISMVSYFRAPADEDK